MDKKICPDCGREFDLQDEKCVDCGTPLVVQEVLDPEDYAIVFHDPVRENVETVQTDLAAHGIEGKARYVNLTDFNVSIRGALTWALLVRREDADRTLETLHKLYGYTEEAEREEVEAVDPKYQFILDTPAEQLAGKSNWARLCDAIRDPNLPESLAEKASTALIAAGEAAEDFVLDALISELRQDHYAVRVCSIEAFVTVLAEIGSEKTIKKLLELCADPDSTLRINAVHCLGEVATADYAPAILPLLEDEDDDVRQEANAALEQTTGESVSPEYIYTPEDGKRVRKEWEELLELA